MAKRRGRRSAFDESSGYMDEMLDSAEEAIEAEQSTGQGRPGHAGEVGRDKAGRSKATYDLSLARQELVREIAAAEEVALSDVIEAAVTLLAEAWRAGAVDLGAYKQPARSLRVLWKLEPPEEFGLFDE